MKITWDISWNIGHLEIDKQHQEWIEIFNRLETAVLSGESTDELQKTTLKELLDYAHYHFACEERFMMAINYPAAAQHRRLHKNFDSIIYEKFRMLEDGGLVLNSTLLSLMKNWLQEHIQVEDQKFGNYLKTLK